MTRTTVVALEVLGLALAAVIGLVAFGVIGTGDSGERPAVSSEALITQEEEEEEGGAGPAEPDEWFLAQRQAGAVMTAVLVHGFPETSRIWDSLRNVLGRDSIAVALPGFGAPRPAGFATTKDAYAEWLADELNGIGEPIDLVGHDVGALLAMRVATAFEVPLRSFVVDVAPIFHPGFEWPERVQELQTPGVGELLIAATREADPKDPDSTAARLAGAGVPIDEARAMGAANDETMSRSILDFYRSAVPNVAADWWQDVNGPIDSRGLVLLLPDPARGRGDVPRSRASARRRDGAPGRVSVTAGWPRLPRSWQRSCSASGHPSTGSFTASEADAGLEPVTPSLRGTVQSASPGPRRLPEPESSAKRRPGRRPRTGSSLPRALPSSGPPPAVLNPRARSRNRFGEELGTCRVVVLPERARKPHRFE